MKRISWIFTTLAALAFTATAQVPSLINYQGRLTDKAGTPVNGPVNIGIKIFDAATDGKAYYSEDIGEVTVVNGVYSFNYGAGKSVAEATETIGTGDGAEKVFTVTVSQAPIVGKVSITDGTSTWTSDGSTTQTEILGTVDAASGTVTAIFLKTAPDKGKDILVTYEHDEEGIFGSLLRLPEPWLELSINGKPLSPRQRLVTVPYASVSQYSVRNEVAERNSKILDKVAEIVLSEDQAFSFGGISTYFLGSENITNLRLDGDAVGDTGATINEQTNMHANANGRYFWTWVEVQSKNPIIIDVVNTDYVPYLIALGYLYKEPVKSVIYSDNTSMPLISKYKVADYNVYLNPLPRKEIKKIEHHNGGRPKTWATGGGLYSIHHLTLRTKFPSYVKDEPSKLKIEFIGTNINRLFEFFYVTVKILHKPDVEPVQFIQNGQELALDFTKPGDIHFDFTLKEHVEVKPFDINFILKSIRYTVK
jgi:hypothetical protein